MSTTKAMMSTFLYLGTVRSARCGVWGVGCGCGVWGVGVAVGFGGGNDCLGMLTWSVLSNAETDLVVLSFDISFRLYRLHLSAGGRLLVAFILYVAFNRLHEGNLDRDITVAALAR